MPHGPTMACPQEEIELLSAALQPMAAQQHLSPEELAQALRSHGAKVAEEDRDQPLVLGRWDRGWVVMDGGW